MRTRGGVWVLSEQLVVGDSSGLIYVVLLVWIPVGDHPLWKCILNGVLTFFVLDPDILGIHVGVCPWSSPPSRVPHPQIQP